MNGPAFRIEGDAEECQMPRCPEERRAGSLTLENACASLCLTVVFHFAKRDTSCHTGPNDTLTSTA